MSSLPPVLGFAVTIGDRPLPLHAPRLAMLGQRTPVPADGAGPAWSGVVLSPISSGNPNPGGTPASGTAVAGDVRVLLAGEFYNRGELIRALGAAAPAPGDDAALVLACWLRYGTSALRLFNGRYALLLQDGQRFVAATDHAASVPLHLAVARDDAADRAGTAAALTLAAATEAKALSGVGVPVRRVPAGTALLLDLSGSDPSGQSLRTWAPPLHRDLTEGPQAVAAVRAELRRAVTARTAGDPAPTVVLSGGIDSSAVAALAAASCAGVHSVTLGTDAGDEFDAARLVAQHLGTVHRELTVDSRELVRELAWTVWAAEVADPDILEYLMPLVALYRRLPGPPRRILTGYGADIPLGGMHRDTVALGTLDEVLARDMETFDGLNELAPALSGIAGHWSTHPYWDRDVLGLMVSLEPGLKRREDTDKWVLRRAFAGVLPAETVNRRKLGIHEGSGTTSTWSRLLRESGVPEADVHRAKAAAAQQLYERLIVGGGHPDDDAGADRVDNRAEMTGQR